MASNLYADYYVEDLSPETDKEARRGNREKAEKFGLLSFAGWKYF